MDAEPQAAAIWGSMIWYDAQPGQENYVAWGGEVVAQNLKTVALTPYHCVGLTTEGKVVMWGMDFDPWRATFSVPPGLDQVTAVAAGGRFSAALREDGSVVTWGAQGSLPGQRPDDQVRNATAIVAGWDHLLVLTSDGTVLGFGSNGFNKVDVPVGLSNVVSVVAGQNFSAALKADGTVAVWGQVEGNPAVRAEDLTEVVQLAASNLALCAIRADGTVAMLGGGVSMLRVPRGLTNVASIALDSNRALALKTDGTVVVWGSETNSKIPAGLKDVARVAINQHLGLALRKDGSLVSWLLSNGEEWPLPETARRGGISAVFGCWEYAIALGTQRLQGLERVPENQEVHPWQGARFEVECRGFGLKYQWMDNGSVIPGATGPAYSIEGAAIASDAGIRGPYTVAITDLSGASTETRPAYLEVLPTPEPGTLLEWSPSGIHHRITPIQIQGRVVQASTGDVSSALLTDGSIVTWSAGQSGTRIPPAPGLPINSVTSGYWVVTQDFGGTLTNFDLNGHPAAPVPDALAHDVRTVAVSYARLAAVKSDGSAWFWGHWLEERQVASSNVVSVAIGRDFLVLLKEDGTVTTVGGSGVDVPPNLGSVISIAAGHGHCVAQRSDGSVIAWGRNEEGQCNVPENLTRVTSVAAGSYHTVALRSDGTVAAWGKVAANVISGLPLQDVWVPPNLRGVTAIAAGGHNTMALIGVSEWPELRVVRTPAGPVGFWHATQSQFKLVGAGRLNDGQWLPVEGSVVRQGNWNRADLPLTNPVQFLKLELAP